MNKLVKIILDDVARSLRERGDRNYKELEITTNASLYFEFSRLDTSENIDALVANIEESNPQFYVEARPSRKIVGWTDIRVTIDFGDIDEIAKMAQMLRYVDEVEEDGTICA